MEPLAVGYEELCRSDRQANQQPTLLRLEKEKRFPAPPLPGDRVSVWMLSDVRAWLQERRESAEDDLAVARGEGAEASRGAAGEKSEPQAAAAWR